MAEKEDRPPVLTGHIEETIRSIAELHKRHHEEATQQQRVINHVTALAARPWIAAVLILFVVGWVAANTLVPHLGFTPVDPAPFSWLQIVTSVTSLFIVVLVLGAQRHDDELSRHRELLTLELAILNEQKGAKIIQLLEEGRRDNPLLHNRVDPEAEVMAQPADPRTVLDAIKEKAILDQGGAAPPSAFAGRSD